ncbi:hypothetical protein SAMN04487910_1917 [Aquimarina amphilecti]|uniref:Uncharacterized protein n=1 Tax=Aquimarina amphilecti TaxID=1038014 RepID=A0A1H7N1Q1_AQUAM|nr:hypothetical protein [Aquimarina amphilecti]SEL16807.1 hypothetical protein SAMN04487910_1917 [Aquimarina amphilecti]
MTLYCCHRFLFFQYISIIRLLLQKPGKPPWNLFRRKRAVAEIKFHNYGSQADSLFTVILDRKKGILKRLFNK